MKTLNNNIPERHCSFEISKLLKEKGFDVVCDAVYVESDTSRVYPREFIKEGEIINAPTHSVAIEWIMLNFEIWIQLAFGKDHNSIWFDYDVYSLIKPRKDSELGEDGIEYDEDPNEKWLNYETSYDSMIDQRFEIFEKKNYDLPHQAIEAGLLYTLKNLI